MEHEFYLRVDAYRRAMCAADRLLKLGVITQDDYEQIDALISAKYGLFPRSIYR